MLNIFSRFLLYYNFQVWSRVFSRLFSTLKTYFATPRVIFADIIFALILSIFFFFIYVIISMELNGLSFFDYRGYGRLTTGQLNHNYLYLHEIQYTNKSATLRSGQIYSSGCYGLR